MLLLSVRGSPHNAATPVPLYHTELWPGIQEKELTYFTGICRVFEYLCLTFLYLRDMIVLSDNKNRELHFRGAEAVFYA